MTSDNRKNQEHCEIFIEVLYLSVWTPSYSFTRVHMSDCESNASSASSEIRARLQEEIKELPEDIKRLGKREYLKYDGKQYRHIWWTTFGELVIYSKFNSSQLKPLILISFQLV